MIFFTFNYILLQTTAKCFLSNLYLKQGISSVYAMVDFICKGYLELSETRVERELQNEKFLPTIGFEPGTFRLRSESTTTELRGLMSDEWINVHLVLTVLFLEIRWSKIICRVFLSYNICIGLLFVKSLQNVIHDKLFCYIYHVLQVNF